MGQMEPNLATIILSMSTFKIMSDVSAVQPTLPPLIKIEHKDKINKKAIKKILKIFVKGE